MFDRDWRFPNLAISRCAGALLLAVTLLWLAPIRSDAAVAFSQDFESGLGPGETTSGNFQINSSNTALNNGTKMMGHPGIYGPNEYSFYEVQLNLSDFVDLQLQFYFAAEFDTHFDRFNVQANTCPVDPPNDLLTPTSGMTYFTDHLHSPQLGITYFDGAVERTGTAVFDLSAFDLQPQVCIRFQFGSCCGVEDWGMNIDNVVVSGTALCHAVDAIDDQFNVINDGSTQTLSVLNNDRCTADEPITVVRGSGDLTPDRGGVAITNGTQVLYTPASGFVGFEQFTYTAQDAGLDGGGGTPAVDSDSAVVVANVLADVLPDAVDDAIETNQDTPVTISVLANDTLGNGATNQLAIESNPGHGTLAILPGQQIRYSPNFGFFGEDSFEYRLTDDNGDTDVATVVVGVYFVRGTVAIDIDPSDPGNNLNLRAGPGSGFEVAILSVGPYFDAPALIDPLSLKLGPRQANIWGEARARDVDSDGDDDLIVKFLTHQTGIACGDTHASLIGRTLTSQSINGSDQVNTFNCPRVRKRY